MFSSAKFPWVSKYNVKIGELVPIYLGNPNSLLPNQNASNVRSYLSFNGSLFKHESQSEIYMEFYSNDIKSKQIKFNRSTNSYTVDIEFSVPSGTEITGEVLVVEEKYNSITNERVVIDKASIPLFTYKTSNDVGNYINNDLYFSDSKPTLSSLLIFDSISIPSGFSVRNIQINSSVKINDRSILNPNIILYTVDSINGLLPFDLLNPKNYKAHDPFNFKTLSFRLSAHKITNQKNISWVYSGRHFNKEQGITIVRNIGLEPERSPRF